MPNQVVGTIDGEPFYFRARWGQWTLQIAGKYVAEGEDPGAGWWDDSQTLEVFKSAVESAT